MTCCICDAQKECTPAQAFVRGFNLGKAFADSTEEQRRELMRVGMCLRHCHELHEHEAWAKRNVGTEPPWAEGEPAVT